MEAPAPMPAASPRHAYGYGELTLTETPTEEPTPTATATETAYLGGRAGLAAPLIALPEPAPALAPLGAPLTTTHRVISYTYPSTLLRTGDSLYRLTGAEYSSGEYYHYTYDAVGNRQSLTTHAGVVNYAYDAANRLTNVNGQAYTWDDNGNPSTGSGQACSRMGCAPTPIPTPTASPRS